MTQKTGNRLSSEDHTLLFATRRNPAKKRYKPPDRTLCPPGKGISQKKNDPYNNLNYKHLHLYLDLVLF